MYNNTCNKLENKSDEEHFICADLLIVMLVGIWQIDKMGV